MTETTKSDAPELWGIDPDQIYPWTPRAGREVLDGGDWDSEKMEWNRLPTYGKAREGAPVLLFRAIPEKVWMRLSVALKKFEAAKMRAIMAAHAGGPDAIEAESKKLSEVAEECFPDDLVSETVAAALAGWENVASSSGKAIEFAPDNWERNEIVIRRWKNEAFKALYDEAIYSGSADSFT